MAYFVKGNMHQDQYKTVLKSACYLNWMNGPGPVEEFFSGTGELICAMVLHGLKETKLPSFLLSMELKHFYGRWVSWSQKWKENHKKQA